MSEKLDNLEIALIFGGIYILLGDFALAVFFSLSLSIEYEVFQFGYAITVLGIAIWILNPIWERCWDYMVKQDENALILGVGPG